MHLFKSLSDDKHRANRVYINPKKTIDGQIVNLTKIIEDIGYNPSSSFIHPSSTKSNHSLINLILQLGGAYGPLVNIRRANHNKQYFQKYQRSASMTQINQMIKKTTQISDGYQSNINILPSPSTNLISKQMDDKETEEQFQNRIQRMYGFDDLSTISSESSRRSSIDEKTPSGTPTMENSKPKQQVTIREYYPRNEISSVMVNRALSPSVSSQYTIDNQEYEQLLRNHSDVYHDPNPEIIRKPNPDHVTYQQNVSIRYLVPPTPPPPGPLIIRGEHFFS